MLKTRYQRLIAITLFLDFAVSLGCGLQFAMIGGEGEMPMYYLNANLISLYIQPGLTVMAAVQILSFAQSGRFWLPAAKWITLTSAWPSSFSWIWLSTLFSPSCPISLARIPASDMARLGRAPSCS